MQQNPQHTGSLLCTSNLTVGYRHRNGNRHVLLENLNLEVRQGELITLIGPNGCGKSTLIRSLSGLLPLLQGEVRIKDLLASELTASEKSDMLGIVLTDPVFERNMTIFELVAIGRYHHTNWLGTISDADRAIIMGALEKVDLCSKMHHRLSELSDGERQRAMIAKVLAQDVDLIILDEPTAHLDLPNRMELLLLLKHLAHKMGKGVLLSTHELGLGLQVSDKVWLVNRNGNLEQAIPEDLILNNRLDNTFGNNHISFHPFSASFELVPDKKLRIQVVGDGLLTACVIRLLKRLGITITHRLTNGDLLIEVNEQNQTIEVLTPEKPTFTSLTSLQIFLTELLND